MSKIYEKSIVVTSKHLDDLQHVNNLVYLDWVQEIAEEHWTSVLGKKNTEEEYWVVYEHNIQYRRQVFYQEELTIKTYVTPTEGVKIPRIVEFYRGEELVAKAKTNWILMDRQSHRPKRPNKDVMALFGV